MSDAVDEALDRAIAHLAGHGWAMYGIAMAKGDDLVILCPDGVLEFRGKPETCPPEVMAMLKRGPTQ